MLGDRGGGGAVVDQAAGHGRGDRPSANQSIDGAVGQHVLFLQLKQEFIVC